MIKKIRNLVLIAEIIAGLGLIIIVINVYFHDKRSKIKINHQSNIVLLDKKWREEKETKQKEYRAELEAAWGGGIMVAIKDPDLTITDMLDKVATGACLDCKKVEVKVDNFTEFDVLMHLKKPIDKNTAAKIMKVLLQHCSEYINSASFVYEDEIVKTINKRDIDAISNWSSASLATVSDRMHTP